MENLTESVKQELRDIVREALEDAALATPEIGRAEIVKLIGRHRYDKAVRAGHIRRMKAPGQTSRVRMLRRDFVQLIKEGKI